ncbi:RABX5, catalytic core helical domain [Dillenia turbinata]|uniref:RABX5, catalytic core helical domain n=1 Tax=Dillenia turbinata TaxID=194707 RepID=A0AAN8ZKY7_9MAGN
MDSSQHSLSFFDFLDRMRNPASIDLVRSIKSFIVSFSFHTANSESDGKKLQDFLLTMEGSIRDHPLWASASEEEIDCALEGLEKYVMTKLFSRTFAVSSEDIKIDQQISEKISLLQNFLRPEHLDIPPVLHNEASWLLAEKELQKINAFKSPREKLLCILNCCRVINNLLLNVSMSENCVIAGADDFLPVLIYVTIKASPYWDAANPPQLHSNLKFIQLYRRQDKLISESAYYFTNLVSAKSFIVDLNAKSLSMDETEFQRCMDAARTANEVMPVSQSMSWEMQALAGHKDPSSSSSLRSIETSVTGKLVSFCSLGPQNSSCYPSVLIARVNDLVMSPDISLSGSKEYPFLEAEAGELTVGDVEKLLGLYKEVVTKYTRLCRAVGGQTFSNRQSPAPLGSVLSHEEEKSVKFDEEKEIQGL